MNSISTGSEYIYFKNFVIFKTEPSVEENITLLRKVDYSYPTGENNYIFPNNMKISANERSGNIPHIVYRDRQSTIKLAEISSLEEYGYRIKQKIPFQIKFENGEYFGYIKELNLYSYGLSEFEVIEDLKEDIIDLYDEITEAEPHLGYSPKKWKEILDKHIQKL